MYYKFNILTALLVTTLVLVLVVGTFHQQGQQFLVLAGDSDTVEKYTSEPDVFFLGLADVDAYYNDTKLKDRLKLSKSHMKFVVRPKFTKQTFLVKTSVTEVLVRCENLTLNHAEMESLVDCKPLESQVLGDGQQKPSTSGSSSKVNYVKKSTVKVKSKLFATTTQLYPLQREFTDQSIRAILSANQMSTLGFADHTISLGYYMEINFSFGIRCSGNLFTVVNRTETRQIPKRHTQDQFPETARLFGLHGLDVYNNGGLVSLQDFSCERPNQMIPFSLDLDFTYIRRMQFPYLTVRHIMMAQPMSSLWKYEGIIKQTRDSGASSDADSPYNTTIRVISESSIFEYLEFTIDQTFVNTDLKTGFEEMALNHPIGNTLVKGNWSVDSLVKSLEFYIADPTNFKEKMAAAGVEIGVLPSVQVDYKDDSKDPHVQIGVKMTRYILDSLEEILMGSLGKTLRQYLPDEQYTESPSSSTPLSSSSRKPTAASKQQHIEL